MPTVDALPNTFGECLNRCQALMGDPKGRLVNLAYAGPFINQAYSSMAKKIKNASGKNFEAVVEVLGVQPGTSDLSPYQQYGDPTAQPVTQNGPLVGLTDPLRLWTKTAGQLPQFYVQARGPRETLPHVNPPGITPGNFGTCVTWTWMGYKLSITPVAGPQDIQVYGRFNPPRLTGLNDQLLLYPDMTDTLAYAACALFGVERTNPAILAGYVDEANAGIDNIVADIIRQGQKTPRRLAKMGSSDGSWWGWGNGSWAP